MSKGIMSDCDFHLEQMDTGHWWMCIEDPVGSSWHINLHARGKITANIEKDR